METNGQFLKYLKKENPKFIFSLIKFSGFLLNFNQINKIYSFYRPPPDPNESSSSCVTITLICILLLPQTNNASP